MSSGPFVPSGAPPQDALGSSVGNLAKRVAILEAVSPQAAAASAQWIQVGWPPGPVVSNQGLTQRYPGGWRVMSAYPWGQGGALAASEDSWAKDSWGHDQQAANYAGAADTLSFTVEDADLDTTGNTGGNYVTAYLVYATFRVDPTDAGGVGHIVMNNAYNANGDGDIATWLFPSARYGLAKFDSTGADERYFEAGETITVRAFHTDATARTIYLDQIYFIPLYNIYTGMSGGGNAKATQTTQSIATFATLGPSAATTTDDSFGGGTVVTDTQAINHLWDPAMVFSYWGADWAPAWSGNVVDFDRRHMRHNYFSGRVKADADEGSGLTWAAFVTRMSSSGLPVSCWIPSTNAGFFYMAPDFGALGPPQFVLWQANAESDQVPFSWGNDTAGIVTDVRVYEAFFSSSYLDDEASKPYPPVYP